MRRSEKEIRSAAQLGAILQAADVCRIALSDNDRPYIVPVCFGYEPGRLYFHSATEGKKIDILMKNPRCCFELETGVRIIPAEHPCSWEMRYQSIIGTAPARILEAPGEQRHGLRGNMAHYSAGPADFPDAALRSVAVIRIDIMEMTGKLSGYEKD